VAVASVLGIEPSTEDEEGDGEANPSGHGRVHGKHHDADNQKLDSGDKAEFDTVNEDSFHGGDVLNHASHDVAGAAGVKPVEAEVLNFFVKVRADVEDDILLKAIINHDAPEVQEVLHKETANPEENPFEEFMVTFRIGDDVVDNVACNGGEDDDGGGHDRGAEELQSCKEGVTLEVGKDAEDGMHA